MKNWPSEHTYFKRIHLNANKVRALPILGNLHYRWESLRVDDETNMIYFLVEFLLFILMDFGFILNILICQPQHFVSGITVSMKSLQNPMYSEEWIIFKPEFSWFDSVNVNSIAGIHLKNDWFGIGRWFWMYEWE